MFWIILLVLVGAALLYGASGIILAILKWAGVGVLTVVGGLLGILLVGLAFYYVGFWKVIAVGAVIAIWVIVLYIKNN